MTLEIPQPLEERLQRVARKLHLEEAGYAKLLIAVLDKVLLDEKDSPPGEADLLSIATQGFSPQWWNCYRRLATERESGVITPEDLQSLIQMTEAAEDRHAARLEAIVALAGMRGVEPRQLLSEMGLLPEVLTAG